MMFYLFVAKLSCKTKTDFLIMAFDECTTSEPQSNLELFELKPRTSL